MEVAVSEPIKLQRQQLIELLPHRDPMLLLDRVEVQSGDPLKARGIWVVRPETCAGHFPGNPIMPGILWQEIANQTAGAAVGHVQGEPVHGFYVGCDACQIKALARPGWVVSVDVEVAVRNKRLLVFSAIGRVAGHKKPAFTSTNQRCFRSVDPPSQR